MAEKAQRIALQSAGQEDRAHCAVCVRRCEIQPGKLGCCHSVANVGGVLYSTNFHRVSHESSDPIEKKPVYHFRPGARVYTLGGWGCNLFCQYCRNPEIACLPNKMEERGYAVRPDEVAERAVMAGCQGVGWSYSEPVVWFDFTYACAVAAKERGLFTVYVTNGTLTEEALDRIGPYLDCWRVDLKGFSTTSYEFIGSLPNWEEILDRTRRARRKWGMHVEVVTCLTPGINDTEPEVRALARWIRQDLGEEVPWHVQRFYPLRRMGDRDMTSLAALEQARRIGREEGLRFVYLGNCLADGGVDTSCPGCGRMLVRRRGLLSPEVTLLSGGRCPDCLYETGIKLCGEPALSIAAACRGAAA